MSKIAIDNLQNPLNSFRIEGLWYGSKIYPGQNIKVRHEPCGHVFCSSVSRWRLMEAGRSNLRCPQCAGRVPVIKEAKEVKEVKEVLLPDPPEVRRGRAVAVKLTYDGQTLTVRQWADRLGTSPASIYTRWRARNQGRSVTDEWIIFGRESKSLEPDRETDRLIRSIREALNRDVTEFLDNLIVHRLEPLLLGWLEAGRINPDKTPTDLPALANPDGRYNPGPHPKDDLYIGRDTEGYLVTFRVYRQYYGDEDAAMYLELSDEEKRQHLEDPCIELLTLEQQQQRTPVSQTPAPRTPVSRSPVSRSPAYDSHKDPGTPRTSVSQIPEYQRKKIVFQATKEEKEIKPAEVDTWFDLKVCLPDGFGHDSGPLAREISRRGPKGYTLYLPDIPPGIMAHTNLLAQHLSSLRSVPLERKARIEEMARLAHTPYSGGMAIDPEVYSRDFLPLLTEIDHPVEFSLPPISDDVWEDLAQSPWYRWYLKSRHISSPFVGMAPLYRTMWERLWGWNEIVTRRYIKGTGEYAKDNLYDPDINPLSDDGGPWWVRVLNTITDPDWYKTYTHLETSIMLDSLYMELWLRTCHEAEQEAKIPEIRSKIDNRLSGNLHGVTLSRSHINDLRINVSRCLS